MATETDTDGAEGEAGFTQFARGVTVTSTATLFGTVAGVLSRLLTSGSNDPIGLVVLAAFVAIQFPLYKGLGIDISDFGTKDNLYVVFMTFVLWFITWSLLMTAGSLQ